MMSYRIYRFKPAEAKAKKITSYEDALKDISNFELIEVGTTATYACMEAAYTCEPKIYNSLRSGDVLILVGSGFKGAWARLDLDGNIKFKEAPGFFLKIMGMRMTNIKDQPEEKKTEKPRKILKADHTDQIIADLTGGRPPRMIAPKESGSACQVRINMEDRFADKILQKARTDNGNITMYLAGGYRMDHCCIVESGFDYFIVNCGGKQRLVPLNAISNVEL